MLAGISAVNFNAQSRTWDFNDKTAFPTTTAAMTEETVINGLTFVPGGGSSFGIFNSQGANFNTNYPTDPSYIPTQRCAIGGASYNPSSTNPVDDTTKSPLPTQRYMSFPVNGNSTIKVWSRGGGADRIVLITDGVTVLGSTKHAGSDQVTDAKITTATYTGSGATIYIANAINANSIFKIEVISTVTMAANDVKSGVKANAYSSGNKVFLKDLDSKNTQIEVYSANGILVKSLKASADTSFEINSKGVYFVKLRSEAGEKSVKVLLR